MTMASYHFRLLNVFAMVEDKFSGNPLCVFEDARGIDDATMQSLALQFNLSETTFILPSDRATARVRIFTPAFEMPFAGHPTLGTAHVVRDLSGSDTVRLEMTAGVIPVTSEGNRWTLQANPPAWRPVEASPAELAQMLGIDIEDISEPALWVNTGSDQLIVPLKSAEAVGRCKPVAELLARYGRVNANRYLAYVWAETGAEEICARFFFPKGTAITEDPATGSACANLGGWFVAIGARLPVKRRIRQGDAVKRPSALGLTVDAERRIHVSGDVVEIGRGQITL